MTHRSINLLKSGSIAAIAAASLVFCMPTMARQSGGHESAQGAGQGAGQGRGGQGQGQGQGQGRGQADQGSAGSGDEARAEASGRTDPSSAADAAGAEGIGRTAGGGGRGGSSLDDIMRDLEGDDDDGGDESDRPDWAGGGGGPNDRGGKPSTAGSTRGDMFGDLYVILRDDFGVPILTEEGWVQPIDVDGNPIELDEEGAPVDPSLAQEVELGRLNAGRSPPQVLTRRAEEVITLLNSATDITLDAAGRLVVTADGVSKTIDSPLENMAIYVALMTEGTIPGVDDLPGLDFDALADGEFTAADLKFAAAFLAAASDKGGELVLDEVAYINSFLDINIERDGNVTYSKVDFTDYSYSREGVYGDVTATVLVLQPNGTTWATETVNIYEAVFGSEDYSGSETLAAFAQAADDARAVVNFIHEYEVPAESL